MKYATCFLLLFFIGTTACKKNKKTAPSFLIGTWNWVLTTSGATGQYTETPASTGRHWKHTFSADSLVVISSDVSTSTHRYHIYNDASSGKKVDMILIEPGVPFSFTYFNDTLVLNKQDTTDIFTVILVKQ